MRDIPSPLDGIASPFGPQRTKTLAQLLFASSEPGFTFEPWDISTLYQDRAGTTPVTAAGQSVGLRLDKSQGLRQGPELVTNGSFDGGATGWTVSAGWTVSTSATGSATSSSLYGGGVVTVSGRYYRIEFDVISYTSGTLAITVGGNYVSNASLTGAAMAAGRKSVLVQSGATTSRGVEFYGGTITAVIDNISVRELAGNHEVAVSDAKRGIYGWMPKTGKRNLLNATDTLSTQSVTVTAVAHTLAFTGTGTVTLSGVSTAGPLVGTGAGNRVSLTFTPTAGSLTLTVSGSVTLAQLEPGSTATAYQRVASQDDITEAGVQTCYYVQADGVDDAYVTPTITPNTDKVQVFAGMRKLSDAATSVFMESSGSSVSNTGAFGIFAPDGANKYIFLSRGTTSAFALTTSTSFAAPVTNVFTGIGDISADTSILRIDGSQIASSVTDQGTGNFLAYPIYIYARSGGAIPFNGLDFGHAVRFGPNLDAATIARVEALIARNTPGATL